MHRGYIKLHRKIIDSSFYKMPLVTRLAEHCLIKANHKKQKIYFNYQEVELLSGQFITGRASLSNETGISQRSVRTSLKILENVGFLTIRSTSRFSIITIVKYSDYQNDEEKRPSERPASDQQVTSERPASDQRVTTDKNVKNVKNDKKRTTVAPILFFNGDILKIAVNVHDKFLSTYPKIEIIEQYKKMDAWLLCHPEKKYKNFSAFANNWLARAIPETVATEERDLNVTQRSVLESRRRRLAIEDNGQKELVSGN